MATRGGSRRLPAEDRRADILRAAREVYIAQGRDARVKQIAEAAGVAESVLYDHFGSKDDLYDAAVLDPLEAAVRDIVEGAKRIPSIDDEHRLEILRGLHVEVQETVSEILPLLGVALFARGEAGRTFYEDRLQPLITELVDAAGQAYESWGSDEIDPDTIIRVLLGSHLAIALEGWFGKTDVDPAARGVKVADLVFYGLIGKSRPAS